MESIRIEIENLIDLETLSQEFDIPKKELIAFHNRHCALNETLPDQLPKYIRYLYIPADKKRVWKNSHLLHSRIDFPDAPADLTYGVLIRDSSSEIQMHYLIDIQKGNGNRVSITKRKMYVNDQELDQMMEKLAETASEALYPLDFSLKKNGSPDTILNAKDIQKRWKEECLPKIKQYYVGTVADEFIGKLDRFYEIIDDDPAELYANIFYPVFFLPLYTFYPDYQKREPLNFYFSSIDESVSYDAQFSLQDTFTEDGKIVICIQGEEKNEGEVGRKQGSLNLEYRLDKDTKYISSVEGALSTFYQNEEIRIYIEIYQQKSYI